MSRRSDVLKSLVRHGLSRAGDAVKNLSPVERARRAVRDMADQKAVIDERSIAAEVALVPGLDSVSVRLRSGALRFEASVEGGRPLSLSLFPQGALFAPRGAKEVRFRVEPEEALGRSATSDIAGAIAAMMARRLWGPFLRSAEPGERSIVDRRGNQLTTDLRTVPSVRRIANSNRRAMMLDVFELTAITVEDGKLIMAIGIPFGRMG